MHIQRCLDVCRKMRWPIPSSSALAHCEQVLLNISQHIAANNGWLPFDEYMAQALYAPSLGYYSAGAQKLGESGDFITSPELSPLFGRVMANSMSEVAKPLASFSILEFGAGSGQLARDILASLYEKGCLPNHYYILDVSADLKQRQYSLLAELLPAAIFERIVWLDRLPSSDEPLLVVANEVADAIPCQWVRKQPSHWEAAGVVVDDTNTLQIEWRQVEESLVDHRWLPRDGTAELMAPYHIEIGERALGWFSSMLEAISKGAIWLIDYGFGEKEWYLPERRCGTLMCHYLHRGHSDPLFFPGLQDITYHINFSAFAYLAKNTGWSVDGFVSQADFLLNNGLLESCSALSDEEQFAAANQIKRLTAPGEMGEIFKVLTLSNRMGALPSSNERSNRWHQL